MGALFFIPHGGLWSAYFSLSLTGDYGALTFYLLRLFPFELLIGLIDVIHSLFERGVLESVLQIA